MDLIRPMEREGKHGAYIARYKKVSNSWTRHNGIDFKGTLKIKNENIDESTQNESAPSQEELFKILRHAGLRGKVAIALIAYAGIRPYSISNGDGTDCLRVGDIPELNAKDGTIKIESLPARIIVKITLNKGKKHRNNWRVCKCSVVCRFCCHPRVFVWKGNSSDYRLESGSLDR